MQNVAEGEGVESLEERHLGLVGRWLSAEVGVGLGCELTASRCANDQLGAQQEGFDFIDQRVEGGVHRVSDGFDAGGAAVENAGDGLEIAPILAIEAKFVDLQFLESELGDRQVDSAGRLAGADL